MTPELRTDDLDRIREVERGVAACNVTLAEPSRTLVVAQRAGLVLRVC